MLGCPQVTRLCLEGCYVAGPAPSHQQLFHVAMHDAAAAHAGNHADHPGGPAEPPAAGADAPVEPPPAPAPPQRWQDNLGLLPGLHRLSLLGCHEMTETDCTDLALSLPGSLSELVLCDCEQLTNQGLVALASGLCNHELKVLVLRRATSITASGVVQLLRIAPSLQQLRLEDCPGLSSPQCDLITARFLKAGRPLEVSCSIIASRGRKLDEGVNLVDAEE